MQLHLFEENIYKNNFIKYVELWKKEDIESEYYNLYKQALTNYDEFIAHLLN